MDDRPDNMQKSAGAGGLVSITLPVWWTLAGLLGGLVVGIVIAETAVEAIIIDALQPVGALWLRALQMTIIPLVASLLVMGISQLADAARAGRAARLMLSLMLVILVTGGVVTLFGMPLLLAEFPIPASADAFLGAGGTTPAALDQQLPGIGDFLTSLIAPNLFAAAAETAMLPLTIFFALLALAMQRIPGPQRERLLGFFQALGNAMLVIIGWVLWLAPVGVFALAAGVAVQVGSGAFAALAHYIVVVSIMGGAVLVMAYAVGIVGGRCNPLRFAKAVLPAQTVAISTQSSLASLPAMLDTAKRLELRDAIAEFVLPLAVAIFRATSPAMNLAVVIYVAHLAGVAITPTAMIAGIAVALIISIGSVSLPGTISFVVSIGPIALAMGVPIEPLALLVAVEMLPDIMRTLGNVTMNVAVASAVDTHTATDIDDADSAEL